MHDLVKTAGNRAQAVTRSFRSLLDFVDSRESWPVALDHIVWAVLDFYEKEIGKRKKKLRVSLLKAAEELGEESNGSYTLSQDGGKITKQRRVSKSLDSAGILDFLLRRGIDPKLAGDYTFIATEDKLMGLIASGEIDVEDVAEFVVEKETFALTVRGPKGMERYIGNP